MPGIMGALASGFGGAALGSAVVQVGLDTRQLTTGMSKAKAEVQAGTTQMSSRAAAMGTAFKAGAAIAGAAVIAFAAKAVTAYADAQAVMVQTNAVLKSTGGQANITAAEVVALADRLSELSGADDEAIQASSNLLLTFRDVHNELGRGNDIFNQAQSAILDMATALNQGAIPSQEALKSATLQLGKALNDPITGLTALRRAGVSFSSSQVEVIKNLAESGQLMEAQKIILAELNKEFGGAAKAAGETFAGQLARLNVEIENLMEQVGAALAPTLLELVQALIGVVEALGPLLDMIGKAAPLVGLLGKAFGLMISPLTTAVRLLDDLAHLGLEPTSEQVRILEEAIRPMMAATDRATAMAAAYAGAQREAGAATEETTQSMREQQAAALALVDPVFAVIDAVRQDSEAEDALTEARRRLNRLTEAGKQGTNAYAEAQRAVREAALEAAEAHAGLLGAVQDLKTKVDEGKMSQREARDALREMADAAGLTKDETADLVAELRAGKRALDEWNRTPLDSKTAEVRFNISRVYDTQGPGNRLAAGGVMMRAAHGMIARSPTVLVGEGSYATPFGRGAEAVLPLDDKTMDRLGRAIAKYAGGGSVQVVPVVFADEFNARAMAAMGGGALRRSPL